jgi:hypothetical protein
VLLPYLFFTFLFSALLPFKLEFQPSLSAYFSAVFTNAVMGSAQVTYWYIPVLFILYLLTPGIDFLLKTRHSNYLFYLIIILPFFFSRSETYVTVTSVLYFLGVYSLGILLGEELEAWLDYFAARQWLLIGVLVSSTAALLFCYTQGWKQIGFVNIQESLFYPQKFAASILVLNWFRRSPHIQRDILSMLAKDSFALYFMHFFFVVFGSGIIVPALPLPEPWHFLVGTVILVISVPMVCLGIIRLLRLLFGKNTRMIIGS